MDRLDLVSERENLRIGTARHIHTAPLYKLGWESRPKRQRYYNIRPVLLCSTNRFLGRVLLLLTLRSLSDRSPYGLARTENITVAGIHPNAQEETLGLPGMLCS